MLCLVLKQTFKNLETNLTATSFLRLHNYPMTDTASIPSSSRTVYLWQNTEITKEQYDRLWRIGFRHELSKKVSF